MLSSHWRSILIKVPGKRCFIFVLPFQEAWSATHGFSFFPPSQQPCEVSQAGREYNLWPNGRLTLSSLQSVSNTLIIRHDIWAGCYPGALRMMAAIPTESCELSYELKGRVQAKHSSTSHKHTGSPEDIISPCSPPLWNTIIRREGELDYWNDVCMLKMPSIHSQFMESLAKDFQGKGEAKVIYCYLLWNLPRWSPI